MCVARRLLSARVMTPDCTPTVRRERLPRAASGRVLRGVVLLTALLALGGAALTASGTAAQAAREVDAEHVRLAEIVPALAGTELGGLDLGPAPVPGAVRVVRRAEVLQALAQAGRSAEGLAIPASTRIERRAQTLSPDELERRASSVVADAVAPCAVESLEVRGALVVPEGALTLRAEGPSRPTTGATLVTLIAQVGRREVRTAAQARIACPSAVIAPGAHVEIRVVAGSVVVRADGTARQPGRVGDTIRVFVERTHALVEARVVDASTVEVLR